MSTAERLGQKDPRTVAYLLRIGVPGNAGNGGVRYKTKDEAQEAEEAYRRYTAEPSMYKWGLPKKELYYRPDLAKILEMTEGQTRYAVKKGRIPAGSGVDECQRPFWTAEEVGVVFQEYVPLAPSEPA